MCYNSYTAAEDVHIQSVALAKFGMGVSKCCVLICVADLVALDLTLLQDWLFTLISQAAR